MNIFEIATRNQFRFPFKGSISVEDLWTLSTENLDSVFKTLNSQAKQADEESLLNKKTKEDEILGVKIEIIKYIVKVKLEEENLRLQAKEQAEKKQKIMSILSDKQDQDLQNKSIEELTAMLNQLN